MKRSLRSWLWQIPVDREVDEEIAFHIEMRTRELVERGMDPKAAREAVLARIGDLGRLKRTCVDLGRKREREMRLTQWLEERWDDVKFAMRQLKTAPGFAAVAIVTLALGIGANSAIFALADATLIRPLPYPDSDRLVMVWERNRTVPRAGASPANLRDWEEQSRSFEGMGAVLFGAGGGPLVEGADGSLMSADRQTVTVRFFDVLGVMPVAGRTFQLADAQPSATPVVVIGEGLWRARFGADPSLVGRDIRLNGEPFTVIGIVPDAVQLQRAASVWSLVPELPSSVPRDARFLQVIARLRPGVTVDAAQADLQVVADRLAVTYPESNKDWGVLVQPLRTGVMSPELQLTSIFLLVVVGFVLLLCCANVANLLLARGSVRARELAVRSALGAGTSRIVSQLLTESLVLAALGGLLGVAVGAAMLKLAPAVIPAGLLPAAATIAFDGRVVVFCAAAVLGAGVLFGLGPSWQVTKTSLVQTMSTASRSATPAGRRFRSLLVAAEVAAAVVLLCGAGLLLRTMLVLGSFDPGYRADSDSVLTLDFSLPAPQPGTRYPTVQSLMQFYDEATREISAIPGVRTIGWTTGLPYGTTSELGQQPIEIVGAPRPAAVDRPVADFIAADPGYFTTLDLPVVDGRAFTERDTSESTPVAIVSEAFVRRYLTGTNPIGVRISVVSPNPGITPTAREIVGVVRQVKGRVDDPGELPQVYVPLAQFPLTDTYLVVQASAGRVEALITPVRETIARIDRNVPVRRERTLSDLAALTVAPHRFRAVIVGTFAALALTLAMVGIFGVLAYTVQQRAREFGVRIALGATPARVLRLVMGSAGRVIAAGLVIGLTLAFVLAQSVSAFLFGVQPRDPVTFGAVGLVLLLTAAVACAVPALRAVRVDPVVAFRNE